MVHWSGIWRALGKSKADVVKLIESQPDSELIARAPAFCATPQGSLEG